MVMLHIAELNLINTVTASEIEMVQTAVATFWVSHATYRPSRST